MFEFSGPILNDPSKIEYSVTGKNNRPGACKWQSPMACSVGTAGPKDQCLPKDLFIFFLSYMSFFSILVYLAAEHDQNCHVENLFEINVEKYQKATLWKAWKLTV